MFEVKVDPLKTLLLCTNKFYSSCFCAGSSDMKSQGLLMRMLVAVSCVYILCTAPNVAMALARFTVPEFRVDGSYCNTFACMHLVGCVIFMFNSSINFFVYLTMSSRFRRELKSLFVSTNPVQPQKSSLVSGHH